MRLRRLAELPFLTGVDYSASNNPLIASGYRSTSKIIKDGVMVSSLTVGEKAAACYNRSTDTLVVSTLTVSGVYDDAFPGTDKPLKASIYGKYYELSPACTEQFASIKPGSLVTLYLTADGVGAGVETGAYKTYYGLLKSASAASVTIDVAGTGETIYPTSGNYSGNVGKFISFTCSKDGVGLSAVKLSETNGGDINFDTLSGVSPFANVYDMYTAKVIKDERVYTEQLISYAGRVNDLTGTAPASKIRYLHRNGGGLIDIVVMEGYTYNGYHFGILKRAESGDDTLYTLSYADKTGTAGEYSYSISSDIAVPYGNYVGIIPGGSGPALIYSCKTVGTAARSDFDFDRTVKVGGKTYPFADNYCVYNQITGRFTTLDKAKALCTSFKIFEVNGNAVIIVAS